MLLAITVFADPNNDAAPTGDLTGVQADLNKGVDVNAKDVDGKTPLIGPSVTSTTKPPDYSGNTARNMATKKQPRPPSGLLKRIKYLDCPFKYTS